jgi:folate-binding protein YgfZ
MKTVLLDQSDWDLVSITGADRVRFLQGMVMGDVAGLGDGGWLRTAMLNVKGRLMAIFDVVRRPESLLLICEPGRGDEVSALLGKYAIMDDVAFERVSEPVHRLWTDPAAVWTAPPVFAPPPEAPSPGDEVEVRRIEAGLPRYGVDVTEKSFPFETPLARLIDYQKGCFIGQEPVHRVHARGQAQKHLRALVFSAGDAPPAGASVDHPSRAGVGEVTSSALSPDFGPIALATLHRTAEIGDGVQCDGREAAVAEPPLG